MFKENIRFRIAKSWLTGNGKLDYKSTATVLVNSHAAQKWVICQSGNQLICSYYDLQLLINTYNCGQNVLYILSVGIHTENQVKHYLEIDC